MIEIIGMSESDYKNDEKYPVVKNAIEEIVGFIYVAVSHPVFLRYKSNVQFNLIHDLVRIFNLNLSDKWEVAWKHYWSTRFKNDWLCRVIGGLKTDPFEVFQIDEKTIIKDLNYHKIMERLNEIFPYVNGDEKTETKDESEIQEDAVEKFLHSDTQNNVLPRKKKLRIRSKKEDILFEYEILRTIQDEDPFIDGKANPEYGHSYYIESRIKEVHHKLKGSIIFIQMKVTTHNVDDVTREIVTIHGYDEYDFLPSYHARFKARNQLHKKCSDIIKTVIEYHIPELDIFPAKENYYTDHESQTTIIKEGGNLHLNKFIEFWKTLRS